MSLKLFKRLSANLDLAFPVVMSLFAGSLAINDLYGGKYGDDEILMGNLRASDYQWYQSKGIKETITGGAS